VLADLALIALLFGAVAAVLLADTPVRPAVLFAAACVVPGGALITRLRTGELLADAGLAIGLSLALEILASSVLAWTGWWHPELLAIGLGGVSLALLVGDLLLAWRR
jgi:hypothetical protein